MKKMPVLFIGHGSPMNAIEDNAFTREWVETGRSLPRPRAVLSVSAHWVTGGTSVTDILHPRMVYDMYGFPKELYEVDYRPAGAPELAHAVLGLLPHAIVDNRWGIDHGTWSVLCRMFPEADIPVFQVSLDAGASREDHYAMGQALAPLCEQGVLILGSGNVVHNLPLVEWTRAGGFPWAQEFDHYIQERILAGDTDGVIHYEKAGASSQNAFRTTEHFDPLLYALGAAGSSSGAVVFNDRCIMGSISMTCYRFDEP